MVNGSRHLINANQVRAARGWLGWTQQDLADKAGISKTSIATFERGESVAYDDTLAAIQGAFEAVGVTFLFDGAKGVGIAGK